MTRLEKTLHRFAALIDGSAWFLIAPAVALLWWIDAPMAKTLATWSLYFLVLAAVIIIITRVTFPDFKLHPCIEAAQGGSVSCAIMVAGFFLMFSLLVLSVVLWARPVGT
jgi:prolipoprotein diacylglyceryltransferase